MANESLSLTYANRAAGERVTGLHVHRHTEAFYVLGGELTFEIGAEPETITIGAGGFVAVPPGVAHAYGTAGDQPARWLVIHAPDSGSPTSCAAAATARTSTGTSPPSRPREASPQAGSSSAARLKWSRLQLVAKAYSPGKRLWTAKEVSCGGEANPPSMPEAHGRHERAVAEALPAFLRLVDGNDRPAVGRLVRPRGRTARRGGCRPDQDPTSRVSHEGSRS